MRKVIIFLSLFLLSIFAFSCEDVSQDLSSVETELITDLSAIPAEFGEVIAITSLPAYPSWNQIWFQDENNTIRVIRVSIEAARVHELVTVFPRK